MELLYKHGVRIFKLHHEKDPLDVAISQYEALAKKHYSLENTQNTTLNDKERQEALKASLAHLQRERGRLKTIASVQGRLKDYRAAGMKVFSKNKKTSYKAFANMKAEEHHPTDVLETFMLAEGKPKPSQRHTAHHIVPGKGKLEELVAQIRAHLHINGIRINDPANGVYLLSTDKDTPHWSMPSSRGHLRYHTHQYERWLSLKVTLHNDMDMIKTQLHMIGRLLQDNEPKTAFNKMGRM